MISLPESSTISIKNYEEYDEMYFWLLEYNGSSTFTLGYSPNSNGKIGFALKPKSLDSDTGTTDWLEMSKYLIWTIDDSLSDYEAYSVLSYIVNNETMLKNGIYYKFNESSGILAIAY